MCCGLLRLLGRDMCINALPSLSTGSCWVHHWCAVWSDGVKQAEESEEHELENVDKAVISGIQQVRRAVMSPFSLLSTNSCPPPVH